MNRAASILWATSVALVLSATPVFAGIKVPVKMPSSRAVANGAGTAVKTGDRLHVPGDGKTEYLERTGTGTAGTPIKVLPTIDYSIPRTINQAKGILKGNLAQLVIGGVIAGAVGAVGWVMEDGTKIKKKISDGTPIPANQFGWKVIDGGSCTGNKYTSPSLSMDCLVSYYQSYLGSSYKVQKGSVTTLSPGNVKITVKATYIPNGVVNDYSGRAFQEGACLAPSYQVGYECLSGGPQYTDVTPSDIDTVIGQYMSNQIDPAWLKGLLQEACNGSSSPDACFDSLAEQSYLTGPSIVAGPSTSTLVSSPQGVKQVVTQTNFKITYGNNYFTYSPSKVTTIYNPDGTTETQTDEETEDSPDEEAVTAPELGDPYKPVVDKYDSIAQEVKDTSPGLPQIGYSAWYSFGGACTPLNFELPYYGNYTLDYCPYIYDWVRPIIAFFMAMWTWHRCREMWEEALRVGRPI